MCLFRYIYIYIRALGCLLRAILLPLTVNSIIGYLLLSVVINTFSSFSYLRLVNLLLFSSLIGLNIIAVEGMKREDVWATHESGRQGLWSSRAGY